MSIIDLPCEYEEWWDYQRIFILLSHLRSMRDLNLLISSHTRAGDDSPTSKCLGALKGLVTFLTDYYTPEEQKKFVSLTLPFVARAAGLLEERVPLSGIPCLQKQENSALVLGRKVILSILANAFLCTFPPSGDDTFSFEKIFAVFQSTEAASKKREQAEKLRCVLCYFDRVASDECDLCCVVTFRRQVLAFKELPRIVEWENNTSPLCPFEVDDENLIDESGGHTLQVCFGSSCLGGGVFGGGCSEEEFRFCSCPELLVTRLIMEQLDENEAIIITGVERFAKVTDAKFAGGYCDESERDVFGNLLSSLLALDTQPLVVRSKTSQKQQQLDQYHTDFILWELNKAYTGFHCQQDRGDISTDLLALTVKRGSLAFVAEDYPECGAPFRITSRQSDLGNIPESAAEYIVRGPISAAVVEPSGGMSSPLSPIPEISETPSFSTFLADDIVKAGLRQVEGSTCTRREQEGGEEEMAAKLVHAMFENPAELLGEGSDSTLSGIDLTPSMDELATALASSILKVSAQSHAQETAASVVVKTLSAEELEKNSNTIARSIIADVLTASSPPPPNTTTPQTMGEPTSSSSSVEGLSSMAVNISGNILSEVLEKCSVRPHPPVSIQVEGKDRRISSITNCDNVALHEYINEMTNKAIHEGVTVAQESPPTASLQEKPQAISEAKPQAASPQADLPRPDVIKLAESLVAQSIQNSLKRVQPEIGRKEGESEPLSHPPFKKQPPVHQGLPLGTPLGETSPLMPSPANGSPANGFPEGPGGPKPQDPPPVGPREPFDPEGDTQSTASNMNSRLLTPMSSRAGGYAWSIASTRDEDSRPVSPTDLNKLGLSLSNNTDEFSSLFSDIVINNAISNVTGENVSPHAISTKTKEAQDHTSLPSSSKIGIFLSKLGEAETPSDQTTPYNTTWQNMRRQLLRPITTGPWRCSDEGDVRGDPQLMAMVQWMAASAGGRPRLFYYSLKEESVRELAKVISQLRAKYCTVGQLCQFLVAFGKKAPEEKQKCDLFTFLSQNS